MQTHEKHFSLARDKDIIFLKGYGVWKPALSQECIDSINEAIVDQRGQEFALIMDTSEVKSLTPQCFDAWELAVGLWSELGLKVTARIDKPEASFYKIFLAGFDDILRVKTKFYSCSTQVHALKSLHQSGFQGFENEVEQVI